MNDQDNEDSMERVLGPPIAAWTLLRWASAVLVLASLAGVVTRFLPPSLGRSGDPAQARVTLAFFGLHALAWAAVFVFATRRSRQTDEGE